MKVMVFWILAVLTSTVMAHAEADVDLGEKVFRKCKACHMVGDNAKSKVGPVLNGIMGRPAGTQESFEGKYSEAMVEAGQGGLVWNEENMSDYLEKPKELVPSTKMSFAGLSKPADRANIIAYLLKFSPDYQPSE